MGSGISTEPRRRGDAKAAEGGHQVAGSLELACAGMFARVKAAVHKVYERVVTRFIRVVKRHRANRVTFGREGDFDRIVHPSAAKHFHVAAVWATAKHARGQALAGGLARGVLEFMAVPPIAPGNSAGGRYKATVNVGSIADEPKLVDQLFALVGYAIAVGV